MKRSDVTYGQLDRVLRSLKFACRVDPREPPTRVYEHAPSGAQIYLPTFPEDDHVLEYHMVTVQTTLDGFGIADPSVFAATLQKAG